MVELETKVLYEVPDQVDEEVDDSVLLEEEEELLIDDLRWNIS